MKEKIKNILNNKKVLIGVAVVIAIIILVLIICMIVNKTKKPSSREQVISSMEEMAGSFYEKFYYPNLENGNEEKRKEFLKKFEKTGVKINFDNLTRYETEKNKDSIDLINKYECDKDNTKVIIRPVSPYGIKDYELEVETKCNFDKKDEKKESKK